MKKLPIGISTLKTIIEENYTYVDKTKIALELINSGQYYFLSRPRRFGKSLFLDTLRNIFEGNKELFFGLYIYDKYDWSINYPVILISFAGGNINSATTLDIKFKEILKENQKRLGVECEEYGNASSCFRELIIKTKEQYNQKVVVLVDEYDKVILDNIENREVTKMMREELRGVYSVIKASDEYLRFAFLTGVSKFTKTSIFSGLNNIIDISLDEQYGDICGYSQNDLETTFVPYLEGVDRQKVKEWYNGYNFLGSDMYNPFDILLFIAKGYKFRNYWFETGTPTFLMKLIEKNNYFLPNLANLVVDEKLLNSFDIENIDIEVILYQAGYLTIDKMIEKNRGGVEYLLKIPNFEVKTSLSDSIIDFMTQQKTQKFAYQDRLFDALQDSDMELFKQTLVSIFDTIPYENFTNNTMQNYEGFYASVIFIYLQSLGFDIAGESSNNKGRIDLAIKTKRAIYILEFKIEGKENALEQIKTKGYANAYLKSQKDIYLVGIHFDKAVRNIALFEWERVQVF